VPWQQRTGQEFLDERVVHLAATRANDAAKAAAKAEKKDVVDRLREKVAASKKDVTETNVKLREIPRQGEVGRE
jgi:predicted DsbA family dithiol-disulfide isomerase